MEAKILVFTISHLSIWLKIESLTNDSTLRHMWRKGNSHALTVKLATNNKIKDGYTSSEREFKYILKYTFQGAIF